MLSYSSLRLMPFMCSCRISIFFSLSQPDGLERGWGGRRREKWREEVGGRGEEKGVEVGVEEEGKAGQGRIGGEKDGGRREGEGGKMKSRIGGGEEEVLVKRREMTVN